MRAGRRRPPKIERPGRTAQAGPPAGFFGDMPARRSPWQRSSGLLARTLLFGALLSAPACAPRATPTLFLPPTAAPALLAGAASAVPATSTPAAASATPTSLATPTLCTNDLQFVQDMSVPDGTAVTAGQPVDKQWLVTNTGTCNWGAGYLLKLVSGEAMGAPAEQALYPARAGAPATLRILFTAPREAGVHSGAWQAFAPDGAAFGEAVFIQVNVLP